MPRRSPPQSPDDGRAEREHLDARLDDALRNTFPASDPVAISITGAQPPAAGDPDGHILAGEYKWNGE
ncbi:MAG: hypothetical protein EPN45_05660 [Rhizobiaceae bacterium]|nr:MAG: hypothetical protein EPN45_05660 [Rhizobiaceae bacterium]